MDQATIAARIARGWARSAEIFGAPGQQYRSVDPLAPLESVLATPMVVFDVGPGFGLSRPQGWGVPTEYVLLDTSDVQVGDFLVAGSATYFLARLESLRPALCVVCNRVVSVSSASGSSSKTIIASCPAALLMKSRGDRDDSGMPGSMRPGQFVLYLPQFAGVVIQPYMTVVDDLGNSYSVSAAEMTSYGVRCMITNQQA